MPAAIHVADVRKSFRRLHAGRPYSLQEMLARGFRGLGGRERFWALDGVTFSVERGRAVGIIGTNGSGKSTLLRLVGGIGRPDAGTVHVPGRIGALLDLGSGLHGDLTGRENVFVAGVLNGLSRKEVEARFSDIVDFAELEAFIDSPMRTYSSGMQMRLAFAINVHTDPDALLIDEVLAVGDGRFQRKCLARISSFKERGCALLLVSHGMAVVQEMCDEAIWLDSGRVRAHGSVPDVVREYSMFLRRGTPAPAAARVGASTEAQEAAPDARRDLAIAGVTLQTPDERDLEMLLSGQALRVGIRFEGTSSRPLFRVRLTRDDGLVCYDLRTEQTVIAGSTADAREIELTLDRVDLNSGRYRLDVWAYAHDWIRVDDHWTSTVVVLGDGLREAALNVPHRWTARTGRPAEAAVAARDTNS